MKLKLFILSLLVLTLKLSSQTINKPFFEKRSNHTLNIDKIIKTKQSVSIVFTHNAPIAYENGGWLYISGSIHLFDKENQSKYKLVSFTGIDTTETKKHFYSNVKETKTFTLTFEPIDKKTKTFDIIESEGKGSFNFYNVTLGKHSKTTIEMSKLKEYNPESVLNNNAQFYSGNVVFKFDNCELYGFTMRNPNGSSQKYTPLDIAVFSVNEQDESVIEYPVKGEDGSTFVFAVISYNRIIFRYVGKNIEYYN
jgi:hypothetical protein